MTDAPTFTPGPWRAVQHRHRSNAWKVTLTPGDAHGDIANCLAGLGARTGAEVEANARLIAAAPALYEALTELLAVVEADPNHHDPHSDIYGKMCRARAALTAAQEPK